MSTEAITTEGSAKERILDAAEALFLEQGVSSTSIRAITARAGMNPAAIHYHYGSKDALLFAVAERRVAPINAMRLARLDELEAAEASPAIEALLEAFLGPAVFEAPAALMAVVHHEKMDTAHEIIPKLFGEVHDRFVAAFSRCFPALPTEVIEARFRFSVGVMLHVARGFAHIPMGRDAQHASTDRRVLFGEVLRFLAAGFRAPASEETSR